MNDFIKGWASVCLGSVVGAVLGAASFFAIEALMPQEASADIGLFGSPSHQCSEPFDRSNQFAIDQFRDGIEDFVSDQEKAIEVHADAADAAINDWNDLRRGCSDSIALRLLTRCQNPQT